MIEKVVHYGLLIGTRGALISTFPGTLYQYIPRDSLSVHTEPLNQYIPSLLISTYWASLSVHTEPLYQYKEVAKAQASLLVQCMNKKVFTYKYCTDSESDKKGSRYMYFTNNETLLYFVKVIFKACIKAYFVT